MGYFYGVFYRLAQGTLFTTTVHLVYEDTKCMTDADMPTVMGHERVRGITGGALTHMVLLIPRYSILHID
jgi:hypothetical protein